MTHLIPGLLGSRACAASLEREGARRRAHCGDCRYRGACDTYPLFAEPYCGGKRRCRIAYDLITFIEDALREAGFTAEAVREIALAAVVPSSSIDDAEI